MKAEDKQAVLDLLIAQAGTNKQDRVRINILVSPEASESEYDLVTPIINSREKSY